MYYTSKVAGIHVSCSSSDSSLMGAKVFQTRSQGCHHEEYRRGPRDNTSVLPHTLPLLQRWQVTTHGAQTLSKGRGCTLSHGGACRFNFQRKGASIPQNCTTIPRNFQCHHVVDASSRRSTFETFSTKIAVAEEKPPPVPMCRQLVLFLGSPLCLRNSLNLDSPGFVFLPDDQFAR